MGGADGLGGVQKCARLCPELPRSAQKCRLVGECSPASARVLKPSCKGPIVSGMESFLITVGYGSLALLGTAVGVALLEHWRHPQRGRMTLPPPPLQRAAHVDVDLSTLGASAPGGDAEQRQATVTEAMTRMAQPGATATVSDTQPNWIETRPMAGMSPETEAR